MPRFCPFWALIQHSLPFTSDSPVTLTHPLSFQRTVSARKNHSGVRSFLLAEKEIIQFPIHKHGKIQYSRVMWLFTF